MGEETSAQASGGKVGDGAGGMTVEMERERGRR